MKKSNLFLLSALIQFALLIPITRWARTHRESLREILLTRTFQKKENSRKYSLVEALNTLSGSSVFLNILVAPIGAILWRMRLRKEALAVLATCWTNALARMAIKRLVDRPRPQRFLVRTRKKSHGKSFPSGHVASAICVWGWIIALGLFAQTRLSSTKKLLLAIPAAFVAFTGPARVYLGDHWTTDVLGGYLFGSGWLSLALGLYLRSQERLQASQSPDVSADQAESVSRADFDLIARR